MPLSDFMTATATTQRATMSGGKKGDPTTHLESVKIQPPMPPSAQGQQNVRQLAGLEGSAVQLWETYTESHQHTDDSVTVTQVPDIEIGDRLVTGGITYYVRWADSFPATSTFGATLVVYMTEDKRA